jgi:hypothetical protein
MVWKRILSPLYLFLLDYLRLQDSTWWLTGFYAAVKGFLWGCKQFVKGGGVWTLPLLASRSNPPRKLLKH